MMRDHKGGDDMSQVDAARETLSGFEDRLKSAALRRREIATERRALAFRACAGDAEEKRRLEEINQEDAVLASDMVSLEAAIDKGKTRVNAAEREAAAAQ